MGSEEEEDNPPHQITVPSFWIGEMPVTQALWEAVTGDNPSRFKSPTQPVERISWYDIQEKFLPKLNALTDKTHHSNMGKYALPPETCWEYVAKVHSPYKFSGLDNLQEVGWYNKNSHNQSQSVKLKRPNAFGLYDMSNNVWE